MKTNSLLPRLAGLGILVAAAQLTSCVVVPPSAPYAGGPGPDAGPGPYDGGPGAAEADAEPEPGWSDASGYGVPTYDGDAAYGGFADVAVLPVGAVFVSSDLWYYHGYWYHRGPHGYRRARHVDHHWTEHVARHRTWVTHHYVHHDIHRDVRHDVRHDVHHDVHNEVRHDVRHDVKKDEHHEVHREVKKEVKKDVKKDEHKHE